MEDDEVVIRRLVDIKLNAVSAQVNGGLEGFKRIIGEIFGKAPVGDIQSF
jgi:hypothetical protein